MLGTILLLLLLLPPSLLLLSSTVVFPHNPLLKTQNSQMTIQKDGGNGRRRYRPSRDEYRMW